MIEFRTETKRAQLHDPRKNFALAEIESEVRHDPLTGDTARICHFAMRAPPAPDLTEIDALSRPGCPFCPERIEAVTPRFPDDLVPGGRLRRGEATLIPNLFPYDDFSAIAVLCSEHVQRMDAMPERVVVDGLAVARDFIGVAAGRVAAGRPAYGMVTWNYMPPSGGSQVHPHMQVIVTASPGNALARQLAAAQAFRARTGRVYAEALLEAERDGPRWIGEQGRVAWLAPFTPAGVLGDAVAVIRDRATLADLDDADVADFAASLVRVLKAFATRGLWSFNLCLMPDAFGAAPPRHRLTARLLPRFYLNAKLHVSDASYLQLLLEERFAMLTPEEVAADLRARFATA
jgi:UDPglucose--hexose-1-phosphate uridylyltransferase